MQISFTANEVSAILVPQSVKGFTSEIIGGIAALANAIPGDLSFLGNTKYKSAVFVTKASIVLLPIGFSGEPQPNQLFIFVENPSASLGLICARIEQKLWPKPLPGIHPLAWVDPRAEVASSATVGPLCVVEAGVQIGERVHLQAQVFVGQNAVIGEDCWLMPGVIVSAESEIKSRVQIQSGAVIGSDGFGYEFHAGHHVKVPQIGNVLVEDDVEIGANTTIDRARFSRSVIGAGTKIDNLVQIGHNVIVGRHCMICAQVGISGSSVIEDYVVIGGQAGVAGHLKVGRGSRIDGQAGVNTDLISGSFVKGSPCMPYYLNQRINVLRRRLPDLFRRVDVIEQQMTNVK